MKKLVQINVVCNGSTGKIMCDIANEAEKKQYDVYCFYGRGKGIENIKNFRIGNNFSVFFHLCLARMGFNGHGSYFSTKKLIKKLKKINPDIIHLHNIHGYYLNLRVFFKYLKNEYNGKVIWTLHDCWAFTGHCSYFTMINCEKWKKKCHDCPQLYCYPKQMFDTTAREYCFKKKLFSGLKNLIIVTPSVWLKDLVKKSYLSEYPVEVIHNGINTNIFKPTYNNQIYEKYHIPKNKKIILGVANIWEERKGLDDFLELNKKLNLSKYQIVLVGIDKKSFKKIPNSIIKIERTDNIYELAAIYTIANVLFNPTYEDNYPTVNLESIACNTFVIAYNTGGCKEQIQLSNFGYLIKKKDYNRLIALLEKIPKKKQSNSFFGMNEMIKKYIDIY